MAQAVTFEQKMARLEQIVKAMDRGEVPLDESLKLFEEGTALVRECEKMLDEAQQQVMMISVSSNGDPVEAEYHDSQDV